MHAQKARGDRPVAAGMVKRAQNELPLDPLPGRP